MCIMPLKGWGFPYEFDVVRTGRAHNPRLIEKMAREGVPSDPEHTIA